MSNQLVTYEKKDKTAVLTLNRPDVLNAWNLQMVEKAVDFIGLMSRDEDARVLIITGTGRAFCSGADVGQMKKIAKGKPHLQKEAKGERCWTNPHSLRC